MTRIILTLMLTFAVLAAPAARTHKEFGFVGTLTKVDLAKKRVVLKYKDNGKDETVVLVLTPKTEITKDKKKVPTSQLKVGLTVAATAWGDGDAAELDALQIRIVPPIAK